MDLTPDSPITITAPGRGACPGRVLELLPVPQLPDLDSAQARSILQEWHVSRVALIGYEPAPGAALVFAALEVAGQWVDLQRQPLTFTPRP